MQLLLPQDDLVGIAVEGLAPADQKNASAETLEIADLALYYGKAATFTSASAVEVVQFKYSISRAHEDYRVSDAKKTIAKFTTTWREQQEFSDKLSFGIITNRSIYSAFEEAVRGLAAGTPLSGDAAGQARQLKKACGLDGDSLSAFARKLSVTGLSGNLDDTKRSVSRTLIDWSAASDPIARARLGELTRMVRDKAGHAGTNRNVIRRTDVLAALSIGGLEDLLPCPVNLAAIGEIVERKQLQAAVDLISQLGRPLLIHAAGGVGKIVFMESLASSFQDQHEVVFFDCFGGGAYRSQEDARHFPNRGLVHIVNSLACTGLCDPLLPDSDDAGRLLRTFRKRLEQCAATLSRASLAKKLLLFLDAIDNAAEHARDSGEVSFPTLLVEAVRDDPIPGVNLVLSSRSHRIPLHHLDYDGFELLPFSVAETEAYLRARLPDLTEVEIRVAQARSGGNARVLEYLVDSGRGLLDQSEIENKLELDVLIQRRIDDALSVAMRRGYKSESVDAFLAGLAVLPPPVPLQEYAQAHGIELSAIESFAADLWPLLERTKHGLMFRDEPTETLIRDQYAALDEPLRRVAANLLAQQDQSVYAARALPGLLQKLGDGARLFELAFDERFPAAIKSTVGRRNIRYARLKSAVRYEATQRNFDRLVHLLLELSTVSAVDQRGAEYILGCPDLVTAAKDVDATRRLFETRGAWQGTRHARLAIAYALSGEADEAYRHAASTQEWIDHYFEQKQEDRVHQPGPEGLDIAAIPFVLATQKKFDRALRWMRRWRDWFAYEVNVRLLSLIDQARGVASGLILDDQVLIDHLSKSIVGTAAALSRAEIGSAAPKDLIVKLSNACKKAAPEIPNAPPGSSGNAPEDGLRKAAALALSLGLRGLASTIASCVAPDRPGMWAFRDHPSDRQLFPFLFHVALNAAAKGKTPREKDIMPRDLVPFSKGMRNDLHGAEFRTELLRRLQKRVVHQKDDSAPGKPTISYEERNDAERFLDDWGSQCCFS